MSRIRYPSLKLRQGCGYRTFAASRLLRFHQRCSEWKISIRRLIPHSRPTRTTNRNELPNEVSWRHQVTSKLPVISDCAGCGCCCLHMGFPSFAGVDVNGQGGIGRDAIYWRQMPESIKQDLFQFMQSYQRQPSQETTDTANLSGLDGPCCWYDPETRRCKHHEHRPSVCRDFQIGGTVCRSWREFYRDKLIEKL